MPEFYNPYNFVRTPGRQAALNDPFAGDYDPSRPENRENHSRYWEGRYTGTIPVRLRVQTPLFITDPNSKKAITADHFSFDCLDHIPATSLKGMLSSAYEIITNSRYRIFSKKQQDKKLGFRTPANAILVPGRVTMAGTQRFVTLFTGTSSPGNNAREPLYAAWLPCYRGRSEDRSCSALKSGREYKNVTIRLYDYERRGMSFSLWQVEKIDNFTLDPITANARRTGTTKTVSGYVVKSGKIFSRKHDERFFFNVGQAVRLDLTDEIIKKYEGLISDYQRVHEGDANPPVAGSVHGEHIRSKRFADLDDGRFVYVKLNSKGKVEGLYPVQISRELNEKAPWGCLDGTLKPAEKLEQLSPADRLFGWVPQEGSEAWRGKVRLMNVSFAGMGSPVEKLKQARPMAILGSPKPSQARFYLGDAEGKPQQNGMEKTKAGYNGDKKLRGRKVYLHHQKFAETGVFPKGMEASNQNRSIRSWIPVGREFTFELRVENLTEYELGGLLTLLSLHENNAYFRLGYGKPLGLGSVSLKLDGDVSLFDMSDRYKSIGKSLSKCMSKDKISESVKNFRAKMTQLYPKEQDSLEEGLKKSMVGTSGDIAYARIDGLPTEPAFEWFVQNERQGKISLPVVGKPLKSYSKPERQNFGRRPR